MQRMSSKNPSPLKGKTRQNIPLKYTGGYTGHVINPHVLLDNVKSAVTGLIKFHEDRIEKIIHQLETTWEKDVNLYSSIEDELEKILSDYESIMAIEHWLEDVI